MGTQGVLVMGTREVSWIDPRGGLVDGYSGGLEDGCLGGLVDGYSGGFVHGYSGGLGDGYSMDTRGVP